MKLAIKLGTLSAANIGIAFLFQWYVLIQLGPGVETDALFAGMTIPQLVLAVISGSLMHVLVPLLAGESEDRLRHDAWGFLALIGGLFGLLAVLLYAAAPWWVPLTVPGFDKAGQMLTVELTRIQLIGMVFAAVNGVQWAAYHARQRFLWAEFTPILASVFALLLLIWALPRFGVIAAAWIGTLRMGAQTLLLTPGMGRPVRPDLKSAAIKEAWQRIKPLLLGTAYYKTDPLIDRFLLSTASSGSLSLYYLAQQIYGAASQVLNKAIAAPLVPILSKLHKAGDMKGFQHAYQRKLLAVGMISIAGLFVFGLIGQEILTFLVGQGNVSAGNIIELWWIMIWLGGMFVGSVMGQISSSSFYALGDTTTPTRIGIYSYTFYIPAKLALFYYFGVLGLALSTSMFFAVNLFLQNRQLKKKYF
ncbi:MAG TPA: lipid II flippase MurJ [Sulfuriferula sp.]|nr:lipid II flippase MurJ [Sulfuriferula sp.]